MRLRPPKEPENKWAQYQHPDLRDDFRKFMWFCFKHLGKTPTDTQYDIANELQGGYSQLVIQALRGAGKSWVLCFYALWRGYCNPLINILIVSASQTKALEHTHMMLRMMAEVPELQWMHPGNRQRSLSDEFRQDNRTARTGFDFGCAPISQAPSVKAVGITGQITGSRADLIIADDIETSENAQTVDMRAKLAEAVKEFANIGKPEGYEVVFLGTPQTEDSIYQQLPKRGYVFRIWPAQYPLLKDLPFYGDRLAPLLRKRIEANPKLCDPQSLGGDPDGGAPTDRRFGTEELMKKWRELGTTSYRLQFMLNTASADADQRPLKLRDLIVCDVPNDLAPPVPIHTTSPEFADKQLPNQGYRGDSLQRAMRTQGEFIAFQEKLMYIDPSGRGTDETAFVVIGRLNGFLWLLKHGGTRQGYTPETLKMLAGVAKEYKVNRVVTEDNFGDGMFRTLFQPVLFETYKCGLEGHKVPNTVHKAKRIADALEPVVSSHRLVVHPRCFEEDMQEQPGVKPEEAHVYRLWYQFTRVTREKDCIPKDDRLDALAGAVTLLSDTLQINSEKTAEEAIRQANERLYKEWADGLDIKTSQQTIHGGYFVLVPPEKKTDAVPINFKTKRRGRAISGFVPIGIIQ